MMALTRSASGAEEPGLPVEKWATGTRNACTMVENRELLEYYTPTPVRGVTYKECGTYEYCKTKYQCLPQNNS